MFLCISERAWPPEKWGERSRVDRSNKGNNFLLLPTWTRTTCDYFLPNDVHFLAHCANTPRSTYIPDSQSFTRFTCFYQCLFPSRLRSCLFSCQLSPPLPAQLSKHHLLSWASPPSALQPLTLPVSPAFSPRYANQQCVQLMPCFLSHLCLLFSASVIQSSPAPGSQSVPSAPAMPLSSLHPTGTPGFTSSLVVSLFLPIPLKSYAPSEHSVQVPLWVSLASAKPIVLTSELTRVLATKFCCIISVLCVYKSFLQVVTGFLVFLVFMLSSLPTPQCLGQMLDCMNVCYHPKRNENLLQFIEISLPPCPLLMSLLELRVILSCLFHSQEYFDRLFSMAYLWNWVLFQL